MCYPLLLTVQGIDLPLGIDKMRGICPDNLRGQEYNHWNHNHLKSAYWFQRMLVMLISEFWIFYLNWFFSFLIIITQTSHPRWHHICIWFTVEKIWKWHLVFSDEKHFLKWYWQMPVDNNEISQLISSYCPLEKVQNGFNNSDDD